MLQRCLMRINVARQSPLVALVGPDRPDDEVRLWGAGSTGRRNTGVKSLCWCFKLQGLTWSFV